MSFTRVEKHEGGDCFRAYQNHDAPRGEPRDVHVIREDGGFRVRINGHKKHTLDNTEALLDKLEELGVVAVGN